MSFQDILWSLYRDARHRYIDALKSDRDVAPILRQIEAMERQFAGKLLSLVRTCNAGRPPEDAASPPRDLAA